MKFINKTTTCLFILLMVLQSCGSSFESNPAKRLYKTLIRKSPWNIASLRIVQYTDSYATEVIWDTTVFDWGKLTFEKYNHEGFTSVLDFSGNIPDMNLGNYTSEIGEKLFLSMKPQHLAVYTEFGSAFTEDKKGKELQFTGKIYEWIPSIYAGSHFPYATFITKQGYYRCDWQLISED